MMQTFGLFTTRFVNGERVRQAREMACLTQVDLGRLVGVSQTMIAHIEKGLKQPSSELADAIARDTGVSFDFLCMPSGVSLPEGSLLFRARSNVPAKRLAQARSSAESAFEIYMRLSERFELPRIKLKPAQGSPPSAARAVRDMLGLSQDKPIPHLIRAFEKAGGVVLAMPKLEGTEAFAVWASNRPVVALGPSGSGDRLRFSAAHEIGHLTMHHSHTARAQAEKDAHSFAAELLMPSEAISGDLDRLLTVEILGRLKQKWGVAMSSLLMRARELGLISRRSYDRLVIEMAPWRMREPTKYDIPIEKPRALRQMAEEIYGTDLDLARITRDFGLPARLIADIFHQYAGKSEIGGQAQAPKVISISSNSFGRR